MKNTYFPCKLGLSVCLMVILFGCRKENEIENNNIIKTPYPLYVSDAEGTLYNLYNINKDTFKIDFLPDGFAIRSITISGNNVLFVKRNTHLSLNDGGNFDYTEKAVTKLANWQNLMLNVASHQRVYLGIDSATGYGVKYSENNGKTWVVDANWDPAITNPQDNKITSFTQLKNGTLFCNDFQNGTLFRRDGKTEPWKQVTMNSLPAGGVYYLSHFGNSLIMADYLGANGVWHSEDNGQNWSQYSGLPGRPILSIMAPFEDVLLAGTDSLGVYKLQGGLFISANNGLGSASSINGIAGKENIYKDGNVVRHYYLATSKGLFRSINQGQDWVLVSPTNNIAPMNFTAIY